MNLKEFFTSTTMKRFYWTTADSFIALATVWVTGINLWWSPLVAAILIGITKAINTTEK